MIYSRRIEVKEVILAVVKQLKQLQRKPRKISEASPVQCSTKPCWNIYDLYMHIIYRSCSYFDIVWSTWIRTLYPD